MRLAVIIPVREAAHLLVDCVDSVVRQDLPADEIFIVVAPSRDATHEIAEDLASASTNIRVLANASADRGSAINRGLDEATADVIGLVDAQARLAPDYFAVSLLVLAETGASVVGGPMRPEGRGVIGLAMAAALRSQFGIGDSQFHFVGKARDVESVYLGVYRMQAFVATGRYNPNLLRTEDDDMNARIRAGGLKIRLDPRIRSTYLCRESIAAIWHQYEGYGLWKIALATLRPSAIRIRHLVPAAFVVSLVVTSGLSIWLWAPALPLLLGLYLASAWTASAVIREIPLWVRAVFPVVTGTMHVAYGTGTLMGVARWSALKAAARRGRGC